MPDVCKNTCWGQFCRGLVSILHQLWEVRYALAKVVTQGTQFTKNSDLADDNRAKSGYTVPKGLKRPCGLRSIFGDETRKTIEEFPQASQPTRVMSGLYAVRLKYLTSPVSHAYEQTTHSFPT